MSQSDQQLNIVEPTEDESIPTQTPTEGVRAKKWDKILNAMLIAVVLVLVCVLVAKAFFVTNVVVSGDSMFPNLINGQTVKVSRTANKNNVNRGDVVVFYLDKPSWFAEHFAFVLPKSQDESSPHKLLIKRVVAVEGDTIWVEEVGEKYKLVIRDSSGNLHYESYVSGEQQLAENSFYLTEQTLRRLADYTKDSPYTIPQDCFFAMGDNRDVSHDSRSADIGDVPYANLFGKVI